MSMHMYVRSQNPLGARLVLVRVPRMSDSFLQSLGCQTVSSQNLQDTRLVLFRIPQYARLVIFRIPKMPDWFLSESPQMPILIQLPHYDWCIIREVLSYPPTGRTHSSIAGNVPAGLICGCSLIGRDNIPLMQLYVQMTFIMFKVTTDGITMGVSFLTILQVSVIFI